jgi:putative FmdB family regulatory protein
MPTYEYRCTSCDHQFELFQRMSDEPRAECPNCGKEAERRLSAGAVFLFKGSGFYITDYRSDSYKKAAGSDAGGAEKSGGDKSGSSSTGASSASEKPVSSPKPETKSSSSKDD